MIIPEISNVDYFLFMLAKELNKYFTKRKKEKSTPDSNILNIPQNIITTIAERIHNIDFVNLDSEDELLLYSYVLTTTLVIKKTGIYVDPHSTYYHERERINGFHFDALFNPDYVAVKNIAEYTYMPTYPEKICLMDIAHDYYGYIKYKSHFKYELMVRLLLDHYNYNPCTGEWYIFLRDIIIGKSYSNHYAITITNDQIIDYIKTLPDSIALMVNLHIKNRMLEENVKYIQKKIEEKQQVYKRSNFYKMFAEE